MSLTEIVVESPNVHLEGPQGLQNSMAIVWLIVWYVSSGATLFSNKFILSSFDGDAMSLGQFHSLLSRPRLTVPLVQG